MLRRQLVSLCRCRTALRNITRYYFCTVEEYASTKECAIMNDLLNPARVTVFLCSLCSLASMGGSQSCLSYAIFFGT